MRHDIRRSTITRDGHIREPSVVLDPARETLRRHRFHATVHQITARCQATAFDRQAPYTSTSSRDHRYATECHRSVPGRPRSIARHHILPHRHYRYATECYRSVPGRPRLIARHHILAYRHATIATRPNVTDQSPARRSYRITPRHHSTDVNHRSDGATRRAPLYTPDTAATARISALRRPTGDVQFINGLHQLSNV